jgi:hypothetical protein
MSEAEEVVLSTALPGFARLGPFDSAQGRLARAPVPTQPVVRRFE